MQVSTCYTVKSNVPLQALNRRRGFARSAELKKRGLGINDKNSRVCMSERIGCCGLRLDSAAMAVELTRTSLFRSAAKSRSVRAQASGRCYCFLTY